MITVLITLFLGAAVGNLASHTERLEHCDKLKNKTKREKVLCEKNFVID